MDTSEGLHPLLRSLIPVADGIARTMGTDCEVAIHDLTHPNHSIVHIVNGHVTGRKVGDELGPLFIRFLQLTEANEDILANYADVEMGRNLRCTKVLVRDEEDTAIGCLCINLVIEDFLKSSSVLGKLCETVSLESIESELEQQEPDEHIRSMVRDIIGNSVRDMAGATRPVGRPQRLEVLRFLEKRGVFLVKGSIDWTAAKLGVSRFTVYGDLEQVRAGEAPADAAE